MTDSGKPKADEPMMNQKTRNGKSRKPPNISVPWGRAASQYRPGLFTKQYFVEHGEACAADVYHALSEEIERLNKEKTEIGERPYERPNYSSFSRYFHWFLILGLIARTDKREPAIYAFLQKRVFYRLTSKGKAEVRAWEDPARAAHPEIH